MTENNPSTFTVREDEKAASIMAYTLSAIHWGTIVVKKAIRVSTWLRTNLAPDLVTIYNAHTLTTSNASSAKSIASREIYLFTNQIIGFHLLPPQEDPADFDSTEPNRYMDPVTVLIGSFKIEGFLRLSMLFNAEKYLDVTRENFTSIYNAEINNISIPASKPMRVPYLIVRQNSVVFSKQQENQNPG